MYLNICSFYKFDENVRSSCYPMFKFCYSRIYEGFLISINFNAQGGSLALYPRIGVFLKMSGRLWGQGVWNQELL